MGVEALVGLEPKDREVTAEAATEGRHQESQAMMPQLIQAVAVVVATKVVMEVRASLLFVGLKVLWVQQMLTLHLCQMLQQLKQLQLKAILY